MKVIFDRERERERGPYFVLKGGSWFNNAQYSRADIHIIITPGTRFQGFRPLIRTRIRGQR